MYLLPSLSFWFYTACLGIRDLTSLLDQLNADVVALNTELLNRLNERDFLRMDQTQLCDYMTATLQAGSAKNGMSTFDDPPFCVILSIQYICTC